MIQGKTLWSDFDSLLHHCTLLCRRLPQYPPSKASFEGKQDAKDSAQRVVAVLCPMIPVILRSAWYEQKLNAYTCIESPAGCLSQIGRSVQQHDLALVLDWHVVMNRLARFEAVGV